VSMDLHRLAGVEGRFADPRELAWAAGFRSIPSERTEGPRTLFYRWVGDEGERGLGIATALAARLVADCEVEDMTGMLLAPPFFVRLCGLKLTVELQRCAPPWYLRPWIRRRIEMVGSISGPISVPNRRLL
jgi:hypothetical protein